MTQIVCNVLPASASTYQTSVLHQKKDIHNLVGVHGYWRRTAAVTLIVHNNHEEVAAGNLLYDKGPAAQTETDCGIKLLCAY